MTFFGSNFRYQNKNSVVETISCFVYRLSRNIAYIMCLNTFSICLLFHLCDIMAFGPFSQLLKVPKLFVARHLAFLAIVLDSLYPTWFAILAVSNFFGGLPHSSVLTLKSSSLNLYAHFQHVCL